MAEADRRELQAFLKQLHDLLLNVVDHGRPTWVVVELQEPMRAAWRDVEPRFQEVVAALDNPQTDGSLQEAGLTGTPLRFKMAGWKRAFERFTGRPGREALRLALKWADVALGSLATIFGAAEPIKEFKEAIEVQTEERPRPGSDTGQ